jgi:trk system potassium uptake protein TrkA
MVQFQLKENSILDGVALAELYQKFQIKILICAVKRDRDVYIPDGEFVLRSNDKIYLSASHAELERFFDAIGKRSHKIKNVIICGGGRVSYYLAQQLLSVGMNVKIIEVNHDTCELLCELLPKATIIHGDATDHNLLMEEGIEQADAVVALTGMDEENIIMSLYAKMKNVSKVVAKINEDSRVQMVERLGIESIVSAKSVTADAILSYVRARQNSAENENVETMYKFVNGRVEAAEFLIKKESKYTNVPLKNLRLKKNNLIACIVRKGKIIIPGGNDHMEIGDSVIVVTMQDKLNALRDILL